MVLRKFSFPHVLTDTLVNTSTLGTYTVKLVVYNQTCGLRANLKDYEEVGVDSAEGEGEEGDNTKCCFSREACSFLNIGKLWSDWFLCTQCCMYTLLYNSWLRFKIQLFVSDSKWPTSLTGLNTIYLVLNEGRKKRNRKRSLPSAWPTFPSQCSLARLQGTSGTQFWCWSQHIWPT